MAAARPLGQRPCERARVATQPAQAQPARPRTEPPISLEHRCPPPGRLVSSPGLLAGAAVPPAGWFSLLPGLAPLCAGGEGGRRRAGFAPRVAAQPSFPHKDHGRPARRPPAGRRARPGRRHPHSSVPLAQRESRGSRARTRARRPPVHRPPLPAGRFSVTASPSPLKNSCCVLCVLRGGWRGWPGGRSVSAFGVAPSPLLLGPRVRPPPSTTPFLPCVPTAWPPRPTLGAPGARRAGVRPTGARASRERVWEGAWRAPPAVFRCLCVCAPPFGAGSYFSPCLARPPLGRPAGRRASLAPALRPLPTPCPLLRLPVSSPHAPRPAGARLFGHRAAAARRAAAWPRARRPPFAPLRVGRAAATQVPGCLPRRRPPPAPPRPLPQRFRSAARVPYSTTPAASDPVRRLRGSAGGGAPPRDAPPPPAFAGGAAPALGAGASPWWRGAGPPRARLPLSFLGRQAHPRPRERAVRGVVVAVTLARRRRGGRGDATGAGRPRGRRDTPPPAPGHPRTLARTPRARPPPFLCHTARPRRGLPDGARARAPPPRVRARRRPPPRAPQILLNGLKWPACLPVAPFVSRRGVFWGGARRDPSRRRPPLSRRRARGAGKGGRGRPGAGGAQRAGARRRARGPAARARGGARLPAARPLRACPPSPAPPPHPQTAPVPPPAETKEPVRASTDVARYRAAWRAQRGRPLFSVCPTRRPLPGRRVRRQ